MAKDLREKKKPRRRDGDPSQEGSPWSVETAWGKASTTDGVPRPGPAETVTVADRRQRAGFGRGGETARRQDSVTKSRLSESANRASVTGMPLDEGSRLILDKYRRKPGAGMEGSSC